MILYLFFPLYKALITVLYFLIRPLLPILLSKNENGERIGKATPSLKKCIWLHAASLGEINGVKELIKRVRTVYPNESFLITTTSLTGKTAVMKLDPTIHAHILPLDIPILMKQFINKIDPRLLIIVETELWPVMLSETSKRNIPIIWINARITEKRLKRYEFLRTFWKSLCIQQINTQSESDAQRFIKAGFTNVYNMYNMKFAMQLPAYDNDILRQSWHLSSQMLTFVAGSTRPQEEETLLIAYDKLKQKYPNLSMIIAPRHLDRLPEVTRLLGDRSWRLYSENKEADIILIDRMGILTEAYSLAEVAFIGGSLYDFGGHNPLEAAYYAKAILMGPFHSSCADSVTKLASVEGIRIVDVQTLSTNLEDLLSHPEERMRMGEAAQSILTRYKESLERNWDTVRNWIDKTANKQ